MSKGGSTQTSSTSIDPQIKEAFLANFQQAQGVAGALPIQQIAGFNPMYQAGEEALVNTALAGPGISGTDLAAQMAAYGGVYQPGQVQGIRSNLGFGGGQMAMPQMAMSPMGGGLGGVSQQDGYGNIPPGFLPTNRGSSYNSTTTSDITGGRRDLAVPINTAPTPSANLSESEQAFNNTLAGAGFGQMSQQQSQAYQQPQSYGQQAQAYQQPQGYGQQTQQIGSIADYMNPYTSQVRTNALADLESARRAAIQQTGERATQARAFGGSRQGVAEALTNQGFAKQAGTLGTSLNEQAFNSAVALQQADIARQQQADLANQQAGLQGAQLRLGGASQLGNLAAQQQALRLGGAQAVMGAGGARQALEQQQMDAIRNVGLQRLGVVQSSLGAQPANLGMQSVTPQYSNPAAGALGGALAGAQIAGPYGAIAGGLLGFLGS